MATKYDVGDRWRYRQKHGNPRLSDHVIGGLREDGGGQWDDRMPTHSRSPEWVLTRADPVDAGPALPAFSDIDRLWLADCIALDGTAYRPVFIECDNTIMTVVPVRHLSHAPTRAYLHTVADQWPTLGGER